MKSSKRYSTINNYRCETDPTVIYSKKKQYSNSKKEEILFSHKSSLEIILGIIKNSQILFLSNISFKKNFSNKNNIKKILIDLKENLNSIYKEQNTKSSFFESQFFKQKSSVQNEIFEKNLKNNNYQKLKDEIEQLKILNFKAINEIRLIQNLAMKNYLINQYLNKNIIKYEEEKEMNVLQPKYNSLITRILKRENIETKKHFKYIVSIKQRQEEEIHRIGKSIEQLRYFIFNKENGYNNYIYAEDIIPEDSKEYTKSITLTNIDRTLHKIFGNKYNKNRKTNNDDEINSENSPMSSVENNIFNQNKKEGDKLYNYINLNMNINLNFNFDKIYNCTDDIKYYSDREINNKDKNGIKMNNKKGFYSTGSLPYLIIKPLNEEQKAEEKI